MAYFSNGTEAMQFQDEYCYNCINDSDKTKGCTVWLLHLQYAYDECNNKGNAKQMLDALIPMDEKTGFADKCSMHKTVRDIAGT